MGIAIYEKHYTFTGDDEIVVMQKAEALEMQGKKVTVRAITFGQFITGYDVSYIEIIHSEEDSVENKR